MRCFSCGFDNPEDSVFCGICGIKLKVVCPYCGFENPPAFRFCGECGEEFTEFCPSCDFKNPKGFKFCGLCGTQLVKGEVRKEKIEKRTVRIIEFGEKGETKSKEAVERKIERRFQEVKPEPRKTKEEIKKEKGTERAPKERKEITPEKSTSVESFEKEREKNITQPEFYDGRKTELTSEDKEEGSKETERRPISVLFADISGFTSLSEKLDPEELNALIGEVLNHLADIVRKNGGYVDKFIGDEVMALFGAPKAHGDDTKRAVETAVEMMDFVREKYAEHNLSLHCGIATGEVVVGSISKRRQDYTAMGDTVNTAKRLEEISKRGQIFVDENTYRLTRHLFEYRPVHNAKLEGKTQEVKVFELVGKKVRQVFIGRKKEIEKVKEILSNPPPKFIAITGEQGVGISSFVDFVSKQIPSLKISTPAVEQTYETLRRILEQVLNLEGSKNIYNDIIKIADEFSVSHHILGYIFGVTFPNSPLEYLSAEQIDEEIFNIVSKILSEKIKGKVLVIDDFENADDRTKDIIFRLTDVQELPFYIMISFDKGKIKDRRLAKFHLIELKNFSLSETKEFISEMLGGDVDDITAKIIWEKTEGNPLFVSELVDSLKESGYLEKQNGHFTLKEGFSLPKAIGIRQLILSKIDKLPYKAKSLLQVISCMDAPHVEIVEEFAKREEIPFKENIKILHEQGFIEIKENSSDIFFKQKIIKDSAYETLLKRKRNEIHSALFEIAYQKSDEDITITLIAGEQAEKSDRLKEAFLMYKKAGELARAKFNFKSAEEYFEKAVSFIPNIGDESVFKDIYSCLMSYGQTLYHLGKLGRATEIFSEAGKYAVEDIEKIDARIMLGDSLQLSGKYTEAEKIYKEVIDELGKKTDFPSRVRTVKVLALLTHLYVDKGKPKDALSWGEKALKCCSQDIIENGKEVYADALNALGRAYIGIGEYEKARDFFREFYEIARDIQNLKKRGVAISNLAASLYYLGDLSTALTYFREYLEIARAIMDIRGQAIALGNISQILFDTGRFQSAMGNIKQSIEIFERIGDKYGLRETKEMFASMKMYTGKFDEAEKIFRELLNEVDSEEKKKSYIGSLALLNILRGDIEKAKEFIKDMEKGTFEFHIAISQILLSKGKYEEAKKEAEKALQHSSKQIHKIISIANLLKIIEEKGVFSPIDKEEKEQLEEELKKALKQFPELNLDVFPALKRKTKPEDNNKKSKDKPTEEKTEKKKEEGSKRRRPTKKEKTRLAVK